MVALTKLRKQIIEQHALDARRDYGFMDLRIDPMAFAAAIDITVEAKSDTNPGVSGVLIKEGDSFGILYATHIPNLGYQRFSVSHELGHYFLPGHVDKILQAGVHKSRAGYAADDEYEREADHFAACLMMPESLVKRRFNHFSDGIEAIKMVGEECGASLTSTAIRYAEVTDAPIAVVLTSGKQVTASFLSQSMIDITKRGIKKNTTLSEASLTYQFNCRPPVGGAEDSRESHLQLWFDVDKSIRCVEEVICLGEYGRNLTVISTEYSPEEKEDEEVEWEPPRFR